MATYRPIGLAFRQVSSLQRSIIGLPANSASIRYGFQVSRMFSKPLNSRTFVSSTSVHGNQLEDRNDSVVDYRELKPLTLTPSDNVLLVDVREIEEVIQGNIPSSVNLPLSSLEKSLESHPDDFIKSNGFPKPKSNQKIIFYCRSGQRSNTATEIAKMKGFKNVKNYKGSWLDWIQKEKSP